MQAGRTIFLKSDLKKNEFDENMGTIFLIQSLKRDEKTNAPMPEKQKISFVTKLH